MAVLGGIGCSVDFENVLTVIRPRNSKSSLTTSTRSRRFLCISALAFPGCCPLSP